MSRVFISECAGDDWCEIWRYIAADNVEAADRLVSEIQTRFQMLAETPRLGRARDDIHAGFRYFPVGRYLILYRIQVDGIGIVRVLHAARHLEEMT